MQFRIEQRFDLPLDAVESALVDPDFYAALGRLPKIGRTSLVSCEREPGAVRLKVRYAFAGDLSPAVRRVVDPARLTWVTDSRCDLATHRTEFTILPDAYAGMLRCAGVYALRDVAGGCVRTAAGDLRVSVPLVGGKVEQAIVSGLREHAAAEAEMLEQWVSSRPDP